MRWRQVIFCCFKTLSFSADLSARAFISLFLVGIFQIGAEAQKVAVIVPEKSATSEKYADELRKNLGRKFNVLDESLSEAAFRSAFIANPFNLTTNEAKNIGAAIGCDFFLLLKLVDQRRSSFDRKEYYEASAFVFVVSTRTGRLLIWKPEIYEAETPVKAERMRFEAILNLSAGLFDGVLKARLSEVNNQSPVKIAEIPAENSAEAENFRAPLPYRRIKPEYTRIAYIYDVAATIDIAVDLDETGAVSRTEIVRWAGFGLDESVTETIRKMNWRPATKNGKALPMRVLLRYNFKKIEKED